MMHFWKHALSLAGLSSGLLALPAAAATLCVNTAGSLPCYARISDAVAAALPGDTVQVSGGTYAESVTITKSISIVTQGATVDADGLSRGFFVNGLAAAGLANVNISGFTIKNAQFEGVLVLNASAVTVSNNTVMNNNNALSGGTCPTIESFEPGEAQDCGEGVHLMGADHSIVTNNTITGNAGGILISDDTGATHDNLVSFNMVMNNPYACGITMASHVQAPQSSSAVPLGVYHNTVYGNKSKSNGNAGGGGAGVGIFASIPGAKTYGNVVVNNYLADSGHPGIALHSHAPGQVLSDNMLVGNTIVHNGADAGDAATFGPTGINVYAASPAPGNIISGNSLQQEAYDVVVKEPSAVQVQYNSLGGQYGVTNLGVSAVNATENWWACPSGPTIPGSCSMVVGTNVQYSPWLWNPIPGQPSY